MPIMPLAIMLILFCPFCPAFCTPNPSKEPYTYYCDGFIILSNHDELLKPLIAVIAEFLTCELHLQLHPNKISIRKLSQGIDFIGYVVFPKHTLLRTKTKKRMLKRLRLINTLYTQGTLNAETMDQSLQSYLGILSHINQYTLSQALKNAYWVRHPTDVPIY